MARVSVTMFATIREAAGVPSVQLDVCDIEELLSKLGRSYGSKLNRLLCEGRTDRERLVILLNGRSIGRSNFRDVRLSDGDEVALFPPVSGG